MEPAPFFVHIIGDVYPVCDKQIEARIHASNDQLSPEPSSTYYRNENHKNTEHEVINFVVSI